MDSLAVDVFGGGRDDGDMLVGRNFRMLILMTCVMSVFPHLWLLSAPKANGLVKEVFEVRSTVVGALL
jgi:hypothetical protein